MALFPQAKKDSGPKPCTYARRSKIQLVYDDPWPTSVGILNTSWNTLHNISNTWHLHITKTKKCVFTLEYLMWNCIYLGLQGEWRPTVPTVHLLLFLCAALLNHSLIKYLCRTLFSVLLETFYCMRYCPWHNNARTTASHQSSFTYANIVLYLVCEHRGALVYL